MQVIVRVLIILLAFSSCSAKSVEPQLSVSQCAAFKKEASNIARLINSASGVVHRQLFNRAARLEKRLDVFCKNPIHEEPQIVVALKVPVKQVIAGKLAGAQTQGNVLSSYNSPDKQAAWQKFYQRSSYCNAYKNSMAELVRCSDEEAAQKLLFEQDWARLHPVKTASVQRQPSNRKAVPTSDEQNVKPFTDEPVISSNEVLRNPKLYVSSQSIPDKASVGFMPLWQYVGPYIIGFLVMLIMLCVVRFTTPYVRNKLKRQLSRYYLGGTLRKGLSTIHYTHYEALNLTSGLDECILDQLLVSQYGIFLLVSQPQLHHIFADRNSDTWVEKDNKGTNHFVNPINILSRQLKLLRDLLNLDSEVIGLVVFNNEVRFNTTVPEQVCLLKQVLNRIESYQETCFEPAKVNEINTVLQAYVSTKKAEEASLSVDEVQRNLDKAA